MSASVGRGSPWIDGEVYADGNGRLVWNSVPARVLLQDVPTVAAALLTVHGTETAQNR